MSEENQAPNQTTTVYLTVSLICSLVVAIACSEINYKGTVHQLGFWMRTFIFIFGVPGGFIGAKIGRMVRDWLMPDSFYTTGGITEIAKTKLFWAIGPQTIGFCIGLGLGAAIPIAIGL